MIKKKMFLVLFILLIVLSCNNGRSSKSANVKKLSLQMETDKKQFSVNDAILIKATLVNNSNENVLINNRFLIGYEEQDDREIYFRIFDADGKRYDLPENHQADILPVALKQTNMQQLAPADAVKANVELSPVYSLKKAGKYKVVGVYESKPFGNTQGVYAEPVYSDTLKIEIR